MEELNDTLESLPRDEGAHRRVMEWIEWMADEVRQELKDNQATWSEQEASLSEKEALTSRARPKGVIAALGKLPCQERDQ